MAKVSKKEIRFRRKLVDEMLSLATSGFGLVAALAWNELIKTTINQYIKPIIGDGSGVVSLLIYAVIVTVLAVTVTYNLARLKDRI